MNDKEYNKVQINRTVRVGKDRWGKKISETTEMLNIRCDTVQEAVDLYQSLKDELSRRRAERLAESRIDKDKDGKEIKIQY